MPSTDHRSTWQPNYHKSITPSIDTRPIRSRLTSLPIPQTPRNPTKPHMGLGHLNLKRLASLRRRSRPRSPAAAELNLPGPPACSYSHQAWPCRAAPHTDHHAPLTEIPFPSIPPTHTGLCVTRGRVQQQQQEKPIGYGQSSRVAFRRQLASCKQQARISRRQASRPSTDTPHAQEATARHDAHTSMATVEGQFVLGWDGRGPGRVRPFAIATTTRLGL